jgi:hypothetical protein
LGTQFSSLPGRINKTKRCSNVSFADIVVERLLNRRTIVWLLFEGLLQPRSSTIVQDLPEPIQRAFEEKNAPGAYGLNIQV